MEEGTLEVAKSHLGSRCCQVALAPESRHPPPPPPHRAPHEAFHLPAQLLPVIHVCAWRLQTLFPTLQGVLALLTPTLPCIV